MLFPIGKENTQIVILSRKNVLATDDGVNVMSIPKGVWS